MYLVAGLGNPQKEYANTRHNAGFLFVDEIQKKHAFSEFALSKKYSSLLAKGTLEGAKALLAKPQTMMNCSGKAVKSLMATRPTLLIAHDDIDLPLGTFKISRNRGSGGHKGVDSVIQSLGTKNFTRIRIGIQPKKGKPKDVKAFVLKPFSATEQSELSKTIKETEAILPSLFK